MDRFKIFNSFFTIVIIAIILTSFSVYCIRFNKEKIITQPDTIYVYVKDSTSIAQIDSLYSVIDSLENINYKYEDELNIALFKLERIRDYNEIAKKGNNIKYLRGWINRVLNE